MTPSPGPDSNPTTGRSSFLRGSVAFSFASVAQKAVAFLLLPVYAQVLTPAEFGTIAVLTAITSLLGTIVSMGLETPVFRAYYAFEGDVEQRYAYLNSLALFMLFAPTLVSLVLGLAFSPFAPSSFGVSSPLFVTAALAMGLNAAATVFPFALMRAQERVRDYLLLSLTTLLAFTGASIVFVVVLDEGVSGWVIAQMVSSLVTLVGSLLLTRWSWSLRGSIAHVRDGLRLGLPLVPHAISHWVLTLSDRLVLQHYLPTSAVGIYNVAYQMGSSVHLLNTQINRAAMPSYGRLLSDRSTIDGLRRTAWHQIAINGVLTLCVGVLGQPVIEIFFPTAYEEAGDLVPLVAVAHFFASLYFIPMSVVAIIVGVTKRIWVLTVTAGVTNFLLNVALIPRYGLVAAAINTAIGYVVLLALVSWRAIRLSSDLAQLLTPLPPLGVFAAAIATFASSLWVETNDPIITFVIRSLIVGAGVLLCFRLVRTPPTPPRSPSP